MSGTQRGRDSAVAELQMSKFLFYFLKLLSLGQIFRKCMISFFSDNLPDKRMLSVSVLVKRQAVFEPVGSASPYRSSTPAPLAKRLARRPFPEVMITVALSLRGRRVIFILLPACPLHLQNSRKLQNFKFQEMLIAF